MEQKKTESSGRESDHSSKGSTCDRSCELSRELALRGLSPGSVTECWVTLGKSMAPLEVNFPKCEMMQKERMIPSSDGSVSPSVVDSTQGDWG